MEIPSNTKIYEHALATFWFDENDFLNVISKIATRNIETMTDYFTYLKKLTNNKKLYVISDVSKASPLDKQTRAFVNEEMKQSYLGLALVSSSPVGRMIANIFFALNTPALPIKVFGNEKDAKAWLKNIADKQN